VTSLTKSQFWPLEESAIRQHLSGLQPRLTEAFTVFCKLVQDEKLSDDRLLSDVRDMLKRNPTLISGRVGNGRTPLHLAALRGHRPVAESMLASGASVDASDQYGLTPLHLAALRGHQSIAELLLASGAYIDAKGKSGTTPLRLAVQEGHMAIVELMKEHEPEYTIHDAALLGDLEKVQTLLLEKPDLVSSRDGLGYPALHWAAEKGHKDVADLILTNKAEVNLHDAALLGDLTRAQTLLTDDPNMANDRDSDGQTPLHWAASRGHTEVAKLLLASNAEVNAESNSGETPLQLAAIGGHKEAAGLLLVHNADITAKNNLRYPGWTPLHLAAARGHKEVAALLLEHNAGIDAKPLPATLHHCTWRLSTGTKT
jgi:ankyrin repeat protein